MDLTKLSKEQLLAELERRKNEEINQERIRRTNDAVLSLKNIDALLMLVPEHCRTSCSDADPCNGGGGVGRVRCTRCFLLHAKKDEYWNEQARLTIYVTCLDAL